MERIREDAYDLYFLPETKKIKFKGPKMIAYYSTYFDKEYKEVYCSDSSSQRYLDCLELNDPINCLEGSNPEIDQFLTPVGWSSFMRWIGHNYRIIQGLIFKSNSQVKIDFICGNEELKCLMLSVYCRYGWLIHAFRIQGKIFMCLTNNEKESQEIESEPEYASEKANKFCFAKFNVIRKITKRVEERELNSNSETDMFNTISYTQIGQHRILHKGFTEFVMSKDDVNKPIDRASFAALKLMHGMYNPLDGCFNLSLYQHMNWWASAKLSGIKKLICGDLYKNFTVSQFKEIPVQMLDKKTSNEQKKCLNALNKLLDFIKSEVKEKEKVYDFHLEVKIKQVIVSASKKSIEDFVPQWYKSDDIPCQEKPYPYKLIFDSF